MVSPFLRPRRFPGALWIARHRACDNPVLVRRDRQGSIVDEGALCDFCGAPIAGEIDLIGASGSTPDLILAERRIRGQRRGREILEDSTRRESERVEREAERDRREAAGARGIAIVAEATAAVLTDAIRAGDVARINKALAVLGVETPILNQAVVLAEAEKTKREKAAKAAGG